MSLRIPINLLPDRCAFNIGRLFITSRTRITIGKKKYLLSQNFRAELNLVSGSDDTSFTENPVFDGGNLRLGDFKLLMAVNTPFCQDVRGRWAPHRPLLFCAYAFVPLFAVIYCTGENSYEDVPSGFFYS